MVAIWVLTLIVMSFSERLVQTARPLDRGPVRVAAAIRTQPVGAAEQSGEVPETVVEY